MKTKISKKQTQPARGHSHKLEWTNHSMIMFLVITIALSLPGFAQETVVINPASPWTVPDGVTSVKVEVWGGGGAGGGSQYSGGNGGGGGGGAYNVSNFTVSPGQAYTISIGAAVSPTSNNANGPDGNPTTVSGYSQSVTANGGKGGLRGSNSNGAGGAGGTGGLYDGGTGGTANGNGAGGGGGAGNNDDGNSGGNTTTGIGGTGIPNNAPYIGGNGGAYKTSNNNDTGNAGISPGGGGGGASTGFLGNAAGGTGADGQVVLTYTVVTCPEITPEITFTDISCYGGADGTITIETVKVDGSPVNDPFYFSVDNGETYTETAIEAPYTFEDLVANEVYEIRVMDSEGCESTDTQQ